MAENQNISGALKQLWSTTAGLTSGSSGDEAKLARARVALAQMLLAGRTAGFANGEAPGEQGGTSEAWRRCVAAVWDAKELVVVSPAAALLWPALSDKAPVVPADGHGLSWPQAPGTSLSDAIGPLRDASGREVWLFTYSAVDQKVALEEDHDSGDGLFPRGTMVGAPHAAGAADFGATSSLPARRAPAWSWVLFAAFLVVTALTMVWVYAAADLTRGAAAEILKGAVVHEVETAGTRQVQIWQGSAPVTGGCLLALQSYMQGATATPDRMTCQAEWTAAWAKQKPTSAGARELWDRVRTWVWRPTDLRGQVSLIWPLTAAGLGIILLVVAAGTARKSYFLGALIDERNRISLSRLQQLAWTVVLFGGFTVLGLFNIALLAGYVRDLDQGEAVQAAVASTGAAQEFWGFFPSMDPSLWAVLGITVLVSPYLSRRIVQAKEVNAGGVDVRDVQVRGVVPEKLERKATPAEASWSDLFTGEGEASADVVDVSRLQHLVITLLLLGGYIVLLVEYVRSLDGTGILLAALTGAPLFAAMPPIDATFVGLLALSHAGYLAFKALPSGTPTG
jgi:hypothetical protein